MGNFVKEGVLFIPKRGNFFVKCSPMVESPYEVRKANEDTPIISCKNCGGDILKRRDFCPKCRSFVPKSEIPNDYYNDKKFYPSKRQIEKSLENSIKYPSENTKIPTNRFGEEEFTLFAFGKRAKEYGEFCKSCGLDEMPIEVPFNQDYVNNEKSGFATQVYLGNPKSSYENGAIVPQANGFHMDIHFRGIRFR